MEKETYLTIKHNCEKEIEKIKGSRFTGRLIKADDRDRAELELELVRKKYYDATHNCFAYRTGIKESSVTRSSDDGEPSGTAGRPIQTVLESSGLTNVLLVVTRYYGGTNLGTGGLIRAYTEAAKEVIAEAEIETVEIKVGVKFSYGYEMTNLVMNLINKFEASVRSEDFSGEPEMTVSVNKGFAGDFIKEIFERSNGIIRAELCF
jgi:uncharacterized YigZ family protein